MAKGKSLGLQSQKTNSSSSSALTAPTWRPSQAGALSIGPKVYINMSMYIYIIQRVWHMAYVVYGI